MSTSVLAFAFLLAGSEGDAFVVQPLANGIPLSVLTVKDAPRETFFAFLPLGLAHDDAGHAQWSHLLEHMLIRVTDPEGMSDGEIEFNGETSDGSVRLDVHAPPALAGKAAAKLAAWLAAGDFDPEVLEREKKNIGRELASTTANGFTHKWAAAAWAQVAVHGADSVHVSGDVEVATADGVADYAAAKLAIGPRVHLFAIGPLPAAEVKALFDAKFTGGGALDALAGVLGGKREEPGNPAAPAAKKEPALRPLQHGELAATWDLPTSQLVRWYVMPDKTPADRVSATLLANLLMMSLQADAELTKAHVVALANADVVRPEGRVLFLSASLPDAALKEAAAAAFQRAIDGIEHPPRIGRLDSFLVMAKNEFAGLPDFPALRRQWSGRPGVDLIEAQIALNVAMREWTTGLTFGQLGAAVRALTPKELLDRRSRDLDPKLASQLLLTPAN